MVPDGGSRLNYRLLVPLLLGATLLQVSVPLARIATSYRAVPLDLPLSLVGLLSSAFALLPVLCMVQIGRHNDRHGEAGPAVVGGLLVGLAILGLWLLADSFAALLCFSCLLGIGQVMVISALQLVTTRCSGPESHDRVLGHFLVATSLGQVLAPMALAATTPAGALYPDGSSIYWLLAAAATGPALACIALARALPPHGRQDYAAVGGIGSMLRTPGLLVIMLSSSLCLAASDLMIVFFPVLGAARGIDAATVGLLLGLRAIASMASRFLFSRLARSMGKAALLAPTMVATGLATIALAISLPTTMLGLVLAISGFCIGLAIACSISLTLVVAPPEGRATAMSLRLTASRLGQFLLPLGAGAAATVLGPGSIFVVMGVSLLGCGSWSGYHHLGGDAALTSLC